ncbi:hypothetical protein GW17_00045588 [Ensete ventricosum]|nr:hypothetical protein GW17_00045588 [Ensete ventricosum]
MSSLRNAIPRRTHKERAQPYVNFLQFQERKRFGLLEKHKDYVLRARAFHQKEDTLTKIERLNSALHTLDHQPENKHVYYAEDRYA